jgi:penicillin amidase
MNRAQTAVGVAEAWKSIVSPSMNLLAADTGGTILHQVVGRVPERLRGAGRLPAPGSDSNWAWKDFLPMAANPRTVDPPGGTLVLAGQDLFAEGEYPRSQSFPGEFAPPWRARRIKSLLAQREAWTVEDCLHLQRDLVSAEAIAVLKQLRPDLEQHSGPVARELMAWDATMDAASNAALLYSQFMLELGDAIGGDEANRVSLARTPLDREEILRLLAGGLDESWWDDVSVEGRQTRTDIIQTLLDRLDGAPAPGKWGDVHTVLFAHPLTWIPRAGSLLVGTWNRGPFPIGGDGSTLNTEDWNRREPFAVTSLPAMRFVTEVGNWDATVLGVPTGQSGRPWSGHYADQIEGWLAVTPPVFPFSREAVETAATARLHLLPRSARIPLTEAVR